MKLGETIWAAVYKTGEVAQGHESDAIGSKLAVDLVIDSCSYLKADLKKGLIEIKQVKLISI